MIVTLQSVITKTATFDGPSIAIDNTIYPNVPPPDWTLGLEIQALGSDTVARFQFSDSVNAFGTVLAGPTFCISGKIVNPGFGGKIITITKKDFADLRFGVASAVLRLSLTNISGTMPTVTYKSWLQV
jgi:hypothetical protein